MLKTRSQGSWKCQNVYKQHQNSSVHLYGQYVPDSPIFAKKLGSWKFGTCGECRWTVDYAAGATLKVANLPLYFNHQLGSCWDPCHHKSKLLSSTKGFTKTLKNRTGSERLLVKIPLKIFLGGSFLYFLWPGLIFHTMKITIGQLYQQPHQPPQICWSHFMCLSRIMSLQPLSQLWEAALVTVVLCAKC